MVGSGQMRQKSTNLPCSHRKFIGTLNLLMSEDFSNKNLLTTSPL
jgi:hypothetical protein